MVKGAKRGTLIQHITHLKDAWTVGSPDELLAAELTAEILRCRPEWRRDPPAFSYFELWQKGRRHELEHLSRNPCYKTVGLKEFQEASKRDKQRLREWQRKQREGAQTGDGLPFANPSFVTRLKGIPRAERTVRVFALNEWLRATVDPAQPGEGWAEERRARYSAERIHGASHDQWEELWLEVDLRALPRHWLLGALSFWQLTQPAETGNLDDVRHAVHIPDVAFFATTDKPFFNILQPSIPPDIEARPILLDKADPLGALVRQLTTTAS